MSFKSYIKAVGTGPKGNRDLSFEEAQDMMRQILFGEAAPEQIAAFLLGWRLKGESNEEFLGALSAIDEFTYKDLVPNSIELGYPFDGKAKNPYLLEDVLKELEKSELSVVVYGDLLQPAKSGLTIQDLCKELNAENLYYFDRKEYCREIHELTDIRMLLGVRTGFNTLEKLPCVANSKSAITGVHHTPYVKKYIEIFSKRYERFALIQGDEGSPELFKKGKLWISQGGEITEEIVDPEFYGIKPLEKSKDLARLNAAIWLYVAGEYKTLKEAYEFLEK
ncbi:MAG: glycosyl transferase [Campylobacterales bacterium]|nr:glycosyl transferase [Campylobacterales bacterium]